MSLTLTILASSSEANCSLIRSATTTVMVDCGLPRETCMKKLAEIGVDPETIMAICATHGHNDHVGGLDGFAGRLSIPVYCSRGEADFLKISGCRLPLKRFESGSNFVIGDIHVRSFTIPHDAADPVGFRFTAENGSRVISYATDLGWIPPDVENHLLDADLLAIEANYDSDMLKSAPRPRATKVRIAGGAGHLSNDQTCEMLTRISDGRPSEVVIMHVSQATNDQELCRLMCEQAVAGRGVRIMMATDVIGRAL